MKRSVRTAIATALASFCLCSGAGAKFVTFQIPGAKTVSPSYINDKGQVSGAYTDSSGEHGFLRQPDGTLVTFDVDVSGMTMPSGITATGAVTGWYEGSGQEGGFVRAPDGTITTFTVPHAVVGISVGGTNKNGWIVGGYRRKPHARGLVQPYLRSPSGKATEFTVPGATGGAGASVVNNFQTVAGTAWISGNKDHVLGFVRSADGTSTLFGTTDLRLVIAGINDADTVAGWCNLGEPVGFVRTSDGTLTTFAAPNGSAATFVFAINNAGTIAGAATDSTQTHHGYLRAADGTFTTVDPKGSVSTELLAINNKGVVAGDYANADGAVFGFVGKP